MEKWRWKIAKVENGKVTAISEGTTKIIATASDGSTATCTVTVKKLQIQMKEIQMIQQHQRNH